MSVKKITSVKYKCKCEAVDVKGKICGHEWESDHIPERCAKCKRYTWNRKAIRHGREGSQLKAFGKSQTISEWGREYGLDRRTIHARIKNGWTVEDAIQTAVQGE